MFAYPINMTKIFIAVGYLKNIEAVGNEDVSVEVLNFSLPLKIFWF